MFRRSLQLFFVPLFALSAAPCPGQPCRFVVTDVDGDRLSACDGHVTIVTIMTRRDEAKARAVGDNVPHQYLGDPHFRLITVVHLQDRLSSLFPSLTLALIRHRMDVEARRIQPIYTAKHLRRDARDDMFVVADFEGEIAVSSGEASSLDEFAVFVFNQAGQVIRRWSDAPSSEQLRAALEEAR
jgi:hypothetical protein